VVLDIVMPGMSGLDAIHYLRAAHKAMRIVVLSAYTDEQYAFRALQLGAVGYVLKEQSAAELIGAIRQAQTSRPYVSPAIADRVSVLLAEAGSPAPAPHPKTARRFMLTPREEQVLAYLEQGITNRDIGALLGISARTVEVYRTNLMRKLGLVTRAELDRFIQQKQMGAQVPPIKDESSEPVPLIKVESSEPASPVKVESSELVPPVKDEGGEFLPSAERAEPKG
jgi:DNA-binding NarL/FixJ family response regulator